MPTKEGESAARRATSVNTHGKPWPLGQGVLCISADDFTGRKSPGNEAESATPRGKDPPALQLPRQGTRGQLAIATVMWPVGMQPTNRTGLTLVLTLSPFFTQAEMAQAMRGHWRS